MRAFASRARELTECLQAVGLRLRGVRGLMLVDREGLVLVSTVHSAALEDGLGAFTGWVLGPMERAQTEFQMGPLHVLHLAGRDRQLLVVPVSRDVLLLAVADAEASAATLAVHLLATAREILETVLGALEDSPVVHSIGAP